MNTYNVGNFLIFLLVKTFHSITLFRDSDPVRLQL